jgi:membrane associated rhomboid family serine protease
MDWSLVLASQAIPHHIASPDPSGNWHLLIASADVTRASQTIRQYEAENRPHPWQQPYLEGRLIFDWLALIWAVMLTAIHAIAENRPSIVSAGVMHGVDVSNGQWWRLVTATQLHADWGHLASNLSIGIVLLGLVMGRWGTATGMLAALLTGIAGNAANWLLHPERNSLGASGVVMGCIGLLALFPQTDPTSARKIWRGILGSLGGAVMLFMLLGLDPRADVLAHAGGFIAGLGLALLLRVIRRLSHSPFANRLAFLALLLLIALPWISALAEAEASKGNDMRGLQVTGWTGFASHTRLTMTTTATSKWPHPSSPTPFLLERGAVTEWMDGCRDAGISRANLKQAQAYS